MAPLPSSSRHLWSLLLLLGLIGAAFWFGLAIHEGETSLLNQASTPSVNPQIGKTAGVSDLAIPNLGPNPAQASGGAVRAHSLLKETAGKSPRSASEDLRAGRPFAMTEHARTKHFRLALDEIYDPTAPVHEKLRKIPAHADAGSLISFAQSEAQRLGRWPGLVVYPEEGPVDEAHRRVLTEEVLLKTTDTKAAEKLLTKAGLKVTGRPEYSSVHLITAASDPLAALDAIAALGGRSPIENVEPLLMRQFFPLTVPDDTFFPDQWHLKNTGQAGGKAGVDIAVESVWDNYQGQGIRIAIVDDGLQINHPDLLDNVDSANHVDWNGEDNDPSPNPSKDFHGTAVAGIAAARGNNNLGVSGVAPQAKLVGFRILGGLVTDAMIAATASQGSDIIQVKNNSWGTSDGFPSELSPAGDLMEAAMQTSATLGRQGLGTISVWAAGNGRQIGGQSNKDGFSNSMYGITVGAVSNKGALISYSETGSHLCVVAPSGGMVSTDLKGVSGYNSGLNLKNLYEVDYTNNFNGTSAAAPVVSGVAALMLQANPSLNWRDVKEILLRSSVKLAPNDKGWVERDGGGDYPSLPPIKHHHWYGGGLVNARAAVEMAKNWTSLGAMMTETLSQAAPTEETAFNVGTSATTIIIEPDPKTKVTRRSVDFSNNPALRVENVTVTVNATHERKGDLTIQLVSPSGTVSTLAGYSPWDTGKDYEGWTFSSVRHWGESSKGVWTVVASEPDDDVDGEFGSVSITLHGASYPAIELTDAPESRVVPEGSSVSFSSSVASFGKTTRQWLKDGKAIPAATTDTVNIATAQFKDAGIYTYGAKNLTGRVDVPAALGVVRMILPSQQVLAGRTATFKIATASPKVGTRSLLRYKWFVGSRALNDDGRITGTETTTLTIRNVSQADAEDYFCRVSLLDAPSLLTPRATLTITIPPTLESFLPPDDAIVSGAIDYPLIAEHGATSYRATGLPPGLRLDSKTGRITGRATKPGTYRVTVIVSNAAGSNQISFNWVVEDLPAKIVGTHRGLVERMALYNNGYGGSFVLAITKTGSFTGTLTRGKDVHRFKGALDTYAGESFTTANLVIPRAAPATPLDLTFTLENGLLEGSLGRDDEDYVRVWSVQEWTSLPSPLSSLPGLYNVPLVTSATTASYPLGNGYLSATLSPKGKLTYAGRLADGTTLTGGAGLGEGNALPMHHMLYGNTGSIQGALTLGASPAAVFANVDWIKSVQPPNSTTRSYRHGFPLHGLTGTGGRYIAPQGDALVLGLPLTANNAKLIFSEGGLFQPFSVTFGIAAKNIPLLTAGLTNPQQLKLSLNAKTGLLTGSGTAIDIDPLNPSLNRQRSGTYTGLIIPGLNRAEGYFLLPENQSPTSQILSGHFLMKSSATPD